MVHTPNGKMKDKASTPLHPQPQESKNKTKKQQPPHAQNKNTSIRNYIKYWQLP